MQTIISADEARSLDGNRRGDASDLISVAMSRDILVVDDNERHLDILTSILASVGHDVEACSSGVEALQRLERRRYDAVLLDMVMPEVNGMVVNDQMRLTKLNVRTPVIACTANVLIARSQLADKEGVVAIIGKPIEAAALVMAIARLPLPERRRPSLGG